MSSETLKLTGDRCQCPTCKEYFNSTYAFDKHRINTNANKRHCLTVAELEARGWRRGPRGHWRTPGRAAPWHGLVPA